MKITQNGQVITIKLQQAYKTEDLFDVIKGGNYEGGTPQLKTMMGCNNIVFSGVDGFLILAACLKNTITIVQHHENTKGIAKSSIFSWITDGWSDIFNIEGKNNRGAMVSIATEIERILGISE